MAQALVEESPENLSDENNLSLSDNGLKRKYRYVYFHGKDVRTKKFQKKINRKPTLTKTILINSIIIISLIIVLWIIMSIIW